MNRSSRRDVLKVSSSGILMSLAGCSSLQDTDTHTETPTTTDPSKQALRERIDELEAKLETLRQTISKKDDRIEHLEPELDKLKQRKEDQKESKPNTLAGFSNKGLEQARTVAKKVRKAVVVISGERGGGGTGWFLNGGLLITNSHAVDGQSSLTCWTINGDSFTPRLLGASEYETQPYDDVGVLKANIEPPNTLPLGQSSSLTKDQPVIVVGHPGMVGNWVVSIGRYVKDGHSDTVLATEPSMQGNSGSPLVTLDGNVAGILTGEVPQNQKRAGRPPEPAEVKLHEEFPENTYSTHNTTSIIRKYVEQFS